MAYRHVPERVEHALVGENSTRRRYVFEQRAIDGPAARRRSTGCLRERMVLEAGGNEAQRYRQRPDHPSHVPPRFEMRVDTLPPGSLNVSGRSMRRRSDHLYDAPAHQLSDDWRFDNRRPRCRPHRSIASSESTKEVDGGPD